MTLLQRNVDLEKRKLNSRSQIKQKRKTFNQNSNSIRLEWIAVKETGLQFQKQHGSILEFLKRPEENCWQNTKYSVMWWNEKKMFQPQCSVTSARTERSLSAFKWSIPHSTMAHPQTWPEDVGDLARGPKEKNEGIQTQANLMKSMSDCQKLLNRASKFLLQLDSITLPIQEWHHDKNVKELQWPRSPNSSSRENLWHWIRSKTGNTEELMCTLLEC